MVHHLQRIAKASGHEDRIVRGHSMRVTGAMRMALAGLPNTLIKVFGRWASEAVLLYLRETVVQGQGSIITQDIQDGISALPLA